MMDASDLTQFIPGLRTIPRPVQQPEQDSPVPEPPLRYAEDTYSPTMLDRLARIFATIPAAHAVGGRMHSASGGDAVAAFALPFLSGFGRARMQALTNTPGTPEANAVLSQVNRQNQTQDQKLDINAVKLAAKAMREHQQSLKAQQKEAEQTPGTPEYQARVDRESQYQVDLGTATTRKFTAAGLPVPARYRPPAPPKPKAQPKAPKTIQQRAQDIVDTEATADSIRASRGMGGPYGRRKSGIIRSMAAATDANALQGIVRSLPDSDPLSNDDQVVEAYKTASKRLGIVPPQKKRSFMDVLFHGAK